jgi:sugar phosphate permease
MHLKEEKLNGIKTRTILWYMTFFGFAINYVIRINISIAIVDMIDSNYKKFNNDLNGTLTTSECIADEIDNLQNATFANEKNSKKINESVTRLLSLDQRLLNFFEVEIN